MAGEIWAQDIFTVCCALAILFMGTGFGLGISWIMFEDIKRNYWYGKGI